MCWLNSHTMNEETNGFRFFANLFYNISQWLSCWQLNPYYSTVFPLYFQYSTIIVASIQESLLLKSDHFQY